MEKTSNVDEIAGELSVSTSMVYRVMNGRVNPRNAKHVAIRKRLRETAYTKRRRRSKGNILCVTGIETSHSSKLASLEEEIVRAAEFEYLSIHSPETNINSFVERFNISGVIFISHIPVEAVFVPTVILNKIDYSGRYSCILSNEMVGLTKAFSHLRKRGHRRVAFFDDYTLSDYDPHPRRFFAPHVYAVSGLEFDEALIFKTEFKAGEHFASIKAAVNAFLALREPPTAIVLPGCDYLAPFQERIREKGLRIPEDMSFIVFDDIAVDAALNITAVRKPMRNMAKSAFDLLRRKMEFPHSPNTSVLMEPELVERESVAVRKQVEI